VNVTVLPDFLPVSPLGHNAHVEDIVVSGTTIAQIFLAIFLAVASLFFWQWQPSSLTVETSSASGNSIPNSGNALCKAAKGSRDDAPIKRRNLDEGEATAERSSDNTEEIAIVLTSIDAAIVLARGAVEVPTVFTTATVVTPYRRRKGKEVMIESETSKKQKVQEQIDAQVARELEEQLEREDHRRSEQIARNAEIEYHQFASEIPIERRIELISDLVKYQDNYAKIYKFHSQQRKPLTKKQKRDYYMAVIRKEVTKEAKSPDEVPEEKVKEMMQLVPIEEVYIEALKVKHLIIDWKVHTEGHRSYWKITRLGGSSARYQFFIDLLKHLDREDLNQLWILVKKTLSNRPPTNDKEMELWVELSRLYEPDDEDQL
nr:hypothetical protein [Tanacetum cinerariifolium]